MILRKLLAVGMGLVILTSTLLMLATYLLPQSAEALLEAEIENVTDLNQVPEIVDLDLDFGINQNSLLIKIQVQGADQPIPLHFFLGEDLALRPLHQGTLMPHVRGVYQPVNYELLAYGLNGNNSRSLPSYCQITPALTVTKHNPPTNVEATDGYNYDWQKYDLAGQVLDVSLSLPVYNTTTDTVRDDCFIIEQNWRVQTPRDWPLFTVTGSLSEGEGCSGLLVFGRGGNDLNSSPVAWVCYDDIPYDDPKKDPFSRLEQQPSFGSSYIFAETRGGSCGSRLLISKDDLEGGSATIRSQWQDWHDDCSEGQFNQNEDTKKVSGLVVANRATNTANIAASDNQPFLPVPATVGDQGTLDSSCEHNWSAPLIGLLACEILDGLSDTLNFIEGHIKNYLRVDSSDYRDSLSDEAGNTFTYKTAWKNVRDFSTYAIVGTALFMVLSTALDVGLFKNYTVKKYLPRLIVGAIVIQFSWALGDLFIQIFNQIGDILEALLFSSFPGITETADGDWGLDEIFGDGWQSAGLVGGVAAGLTVAGWATLLPIFFTFTMFFLLAFLFLIARKFLIILLLIFTPLGIALWVLPGNDKAWGLYFKTFFYLLVMYPLIVVLISAGKIFSYLILL